MASIVGQSVEMYHTAFLRTACLPLAPAGHVTHLGRRGTEGKSLALKVLFSATIRHDGKGEETFGSSYLHQSGSSQKTADSTLKVEDMLHGY